MTTTQMILKELNRWLIAQLGERRTISLPYLGELRTTLVPAYIRENEGLQTIYPPSVSLLFAPSEFLLDSRHYSLLDFTFPAPSPSEEMVYAISDLLSLPKEVVADTINKELQDLLKSLFRGKRVCLLEIGDLFVSDEGDALLLLNFEPNPSILEYLNRPFAPYTPTVLKVGLDFKDLIHYGANDLPSDSSTLQKFRIMEVEEAQIEQEALPYHHDLIDTSSPSEETQHLVEGDTSEGKDITSEALRSHPHSRKGLWGLLFFLLLIGMGGYWIFFYKKHPTPPSALYEPVQDTIPAIISPIDSIPVVVIEEKPAIDTLTISSGRSLYSYAKEYYGQKMFWVYIYIENAKIIKDPNRISLGTKLVIPDLSKFDVNPDMRIAVKEAMIWESIIMSKKFTTYKETRPIVLERLSQQREKV